MPAEFILDPDLVKVLRGHRARIERLELTSIGCEYDDNFFVIVDDPDDLPEDPECGICYVVNGFEECFVCEEEGGGPGPCQGCTEGSMDPANWILG